MATSWQITETMAPDIAERAIMAVGDCSWGKGQTIDEALKAWRKERGKRPTKKLVKLFDVPATAWIDDFGYFCYKRPLEQQEAASA